MSSVKNEILLKHSKLVICAEEFLFVSCTCCLKDVRLMITLIHHYF